MALEEVQVGQPYDLTLSTNKSLSGATELAILYRKPDGDTGSLAGADASEAISASMTAVINDQTGQWAFQTSAIYSGDTVATKGEAYLVKVLGDFEQ